jgi:RimJ/RimL family protein N-acetyltransferase
MPAGLARYFDRVAAGEASSRSAIIRRVLIAHALECGATRVSLGLEQGVAVAAETRDDAEFLGWFALQARYRPGLCEVGWRLHRRHWGQGFATEGASALIEKAFGQLGVDRVIATAMAGNAASINVMKKCGMSLLKPYDHVPFGPAVEYYRDR